VQEKDRQTRGDVICLMCGTVIGVVRNGRFVHHAGCDRQLPWQARMPRCCRCSGSLYLDPTLSSARFSGYEEPLASVAWDS
jgi:hypothetical protein